tara:strand:+ start:513 stop:2129 length:1617 start_codon:yes stop_codon:yes gene_type:complete
MNILEFKDNAVALVEDIIDYLRNTSQEDVVNRISNFQPRTGRALAGARDTYEVEKALAEIFGKDGAKADRQLTDEAVRELEAWLANAPAEALDPSEEPKDEAERLAAIQWFKNAPNSFTVPGSASIIAALSDPAQLNEDSQEYWDSLQIEGESAVPEFLDPDEERGERTFQDRVDESGSGSPAMLPEMGEAEAGLTDGSGEAEAGVTGESGEGGAEETSSIESDSDLEPSSETDQLIGALDDETLDVIREKFTAAAFFGQDLEKFNVETPKGVMNVLEWLSLPENEGMSDDEVLGWIQGTQWFANNAETARNFDMDFFNEGEAGRDALIDTQRDVILREAKLIGLNWLGSNPELLNELATNATRLGYDIYDVRNALQGVNDLGPEELARGMILSNEQSVQDLAAKYYMPIGTEDAYDVAWSIYKGEESLDSVEAMYREQAKGLFPSLSGLIDQGVSMRAYFSPYKQRIGQLLEVPDVDLMNDPRFQSVLFPASGQGPLSLSETQKFVRGLPEWQYTENARNSARQMVDNIGRMFGMVA